MFQFNVSLGREVELYERVRTNDPANAVLVMAVLAAPTELQQVMRTYDTLAALLAANPEVTNAGYSRVILDDTDLAAYTVDDTLHQIELALPVQTFGSPNVAAGDIWDFIVIAYDPDSTGGTDADIVPIAGYELRINGVAVVPNGSPIAVDFSGGFAIAKQV